MGNGSTARKGQHMKESRWRVIWCVTKLNIDMHAREFPARAWYSMMPRTPHWIGPLSSLPIRIHLHRRWDCVQTCPNPLLYPSSNPGAIWCNDTLADFGLGYVGSTLEDADLVMAWLRERPEVNDTAQLWLYSKRGEGKSTRCSESRLMRLSWWHSDLLFIIVYFPIFRSRSQIRN